MAKESYQIKFEDKVPGAEMTASDFNQIKHQHNNYAGSTRLKGNVSTELGNASDLTCTQKIITDTLQGKVGEDNVITGEGVSTSRVLNQDSATKVLQNYQDNEEFLDEQGYWERSKLHPKQLGAQGLKFKAGDNSVFAKTAKALVLGTDDFTVCVIARTEGSSSTGLPMFGLPNTTYSNSVITINSRTERGTNGITTVLFEKKLDGNALGNSIYFAKNDNTTNLHHIVITRSGTLATCIINGRLVGTITQDRVLDFYNFIYCIENTSYFYGGYMFNYNMTQTESNKLLWNGGRYDEVRLPNSLLSHEKPFYEDVISKVVISNVGLGYVPYRDGYGNIPFPNLYYLVEIEVLSSNGLGRVQLNGVLDNGAFVNVLLYIDSPNVGMKKNSIAVLGNGICRFQKGSSGGFIGEIKITMRKVNCLLEYRPENIRSDRYLNTGTAGSDYDLIYSNPAPEIIYERPYSDLTIQSANPTHHPIAVGQQVIIPDGNIYTAVEPPMSREWSPEDFKLTATP